MSTLFNVVGDRKKDLSRKHGREIDVVEFLAGGICTSLFMSKSDLTFTAVVGNEYFESKDGQAVKVWARKRLEAISDLKWVPVITVYDSAVMDTEYSFNSRTLEQHAISIDVCRFWVAKKPSGDVTSVEWGTPVEKRLTARRGPWNWIELPADPSHPQRDHVSVDPYVGLPAHRDNLNILPYTEEMWAALNQMAKAIDEMSVKLHKLIDSPSGQKRLAEFGSSMLLMLEAPKS